MYYVKEILVLTKSFHRSNWHHYINRYSSSREGFLVGGHTIAKSRLHPERAFGTCASNTWNNELHWSSGQRTKGSGQHETHMHKNQSALGFHDLMSMDVTRRGPKPMKGACRTRGQTHLFNHLQSSCTSLWTSPGDHPEIPKHYHTICGGSVQRCWPKWRRRKVVHITFQWHHLRQHWCKPIHTKKRTTTTDTTINTTTEQKYTLLSKHTLATIYMYIYIYIYICIII